MTETTFETKIYRRSGRHGNVTMRWSVCFMKTLRQLGVPQYTEEEHEVCGCAGSRLMTGQRRLPGSGGEKR